jgi:hypothetical protein
MNHLPTRLTGQEPAQMLQPDRGYVLRILGDRIRQRGRRRVGSCFRVVRRWTWWKNRLWTWKWIHGGSRLIEIDNKQVWLLVCRLVSNEV